MIEIGINKVVKSYGFGNVLDGFSLYIEKGEKVSIIGSNGCGKSTLLNLIARIENISSGEVSIRNKATIGYLKQIPDIEEDNVKVKDILYRSIKEIIDIEDKMRYYESLMQDNNKIDKILKSYGELQERYETIGGYEVSEKLGRIITGFKIERLLDSYYNNLSGGEKTIVGFAAIMIKNPDILLLDEPTNHLDIDSLEWLEGYLNSYKGTIILVSHDRYFLDNVSNKTVLIEKGKEDIYFGNYSYYLEEKKKKELLDIKDYNNQQKEIKHMKESIRKLREFGNIAKNEMFYKRANSIEKRLDKMDKLSKPNDKKELPINFNMENRSGKDVLVVKNLNISYDKVIFNTAEFIINFKERVCLLGSNGSGKTTLIKEIINGNESIKLGSNLSIGYIKQVIDFDDEDLRVIDEAKKYYKEDEQYLRSALYKFMFYGDSIFKKIKSLSGGEKVRLKLFELVNKNVNFLILDEPTNHIDIDTKEMLESALNDFNGTILFVSHDRYFINKIATRILSIENNKIISYPGNYDYYKSKK